jgi:thiamine biosynthesis lipoprotein
MTAHTQTNTGIWEFNHTLSTNAIPVPWPVITLARLAAEVSGETGGAYDITAAPLARLWEREGGGKAQPSGSDLDAARLATGWPKLEIGDGVLRKQHPRLELDASTLASGWASEQVWQVLDRRGYTNALISANGVHRAQGSWTVALEHRGRCTLTNETLATAGSTGLSLARLLVDPRTGRPVEHRTISASLIHTNAARAQALATGLAILGAGEGLPLADRLNLAARFVVERPGRSMDVLESAAWRARTERR